MKIFLYNCIFLILLPFMVVRIFIKSFKDKDYIKGFLNRFGFYRVKPKDNLIWFHAVSLGEVISSKAIIKKILNDNNVVLTVSTPTGLREAKKIYQDDLEVVYAPWDFDLFVRNFIRKFKPIALILFETEIWPNTIHLAYKKNIPSILSNARLSKSSYKKYYSLRLFTKDIFKKITLILAQSKEHVIRFKKMGVLEKNIIQVGSVKFDSNLTSDKETIKNDDIIMASSTHKGEDEIIIDAFSKLKKDLPELKLIIVPRHPERADSILQILNRKKINSKISPDVSDLKNVDVIVVNTTGHLNSLYKIANITFIGGSLMSKYGGHNIIEAASNKCAFIVGPYMKNFEDVLNLFKDKNACIQLLNSDDLVNSYRELLNNNELRINIIDNAIRVVAENKGSSEKQFNNIKRLINYETSNSNNKTI